MMDLAAAVQQVARDAMLDLYAASQSAVPKDRAHKFLTVSARQSRPLTPLEG